MSDVHSDAGTAGEGLSQAEQAFFASGGAQPIPGDDTDQRQDEGQGQQPQGDGQAAEQPRDQRGRFVPIEALDEERGKRKQLAEQVQAANDKVARMEALFEQFRQQQAPKAPAEPQVPGFDDDPAAHLRHRTETTEQRLERIEKEREAERQFDGLKGQVEQLENGFKAANPDYDAAIHHLYGVIVANYQDLGVPPEKAVQMAAIDGVNLSRAAINQGKNPAAVAYAMAKRYGFSGALPQTDTVVKSDGAAAAKIAAIQKGQAAAKSLGAGSGSPASELTLEALADMDPASPEFKKGWERLIGPAR